MLQWTTWATLVFITSVLISKLEAKVKQNLDTSTILPNVPITVQEKIQFLTAHNYLRHLVATDQLPDQPGAANMDYMYWNDDLADKAWTDVQQCVFKHTTFSVPDAFKPAGQNMALHPFSDPATTVYSFFLEHRFSVSGYIYKPLNVSDPDFTHYGHYTQVVWSNTQYVGCARYYCDNYENYLTYCNYGKSGNYDKTLPYISESACSRCTPDAPFCYKGLCIALDTCNKNGFKCLCKNNCNNGTLDRTTCTCRNCPTGLTSYFCDQSCLDTAAYCNLAAFRCPNPIYYQYCPNKCGVADLICAAPIPIITNVNRDNIQSMDITASIMPYMSDVKLPQQSDLGISKPFLSNNKKITTTKRPKNQKINQ